MRAKKSLGANVLASALAFVLVSANLTLLVSAVDTAPAAADTAPSDPTLETVSAAALPTGSAGLRNLRKTTPRLEEPPDRRTARRALTALAFAEAARPFAAHGGFSAAHSKTIEKIGAAVDHYIEEVLDILRTGDADMTIAHGYLNVAADIVGFIRDERAGEMVRRRASAACQIEALPPIEI